MSTEHELQTLAARLLAHRWLSRGDTQVRRALVDEAFRQELDARLAACGLTLLDNPYAAHVAVGLRTEAMDAAFGAGGDEYAASNLGLSTNEVGLLIVLWALIILPKRERQRARREVDDGGQADMFGGEAPLEHGERVSAGISEAALLADFGGRLGGKMKTDMALRRLRRLGFIERRNSMIFEGPLLDLLLDYSTLATRIIEGALAELLSPAPQPGDAAVEIPEAEEEDMEDAD
jgi:hypothetical protein